MNRNFLLQTMMLCGSCIFWTCGGASKNPYPKHSEEEATSSDQHDLQANILTVEFRCLYPQESLEWTGAILCPFNRMIEDHELRTDVNQNWPSSSTFQVFKFPLQVSVLQVQKRSHGEGVHLQNVLSLPHQSSDETETKWKLLGCHDEQGVLLEKTEIERWNGTLFCDVLSEE